MKQRLLLALLMVFASVGLIGAQGASPSSNAVPINITIPAGNGEVIIQVKSDKGLSAAPNLFKSDNEKLTATGGSNTLPWAYTIDQTNSEQKVFFENGSGGSTTDWEGLEMTISGPVSSFEISGENGVIAKSLTSLSFVNNGVLETLILGPTTAGNQGNIGYVSKLKTLECSGNKLSVIPVCKNGSTITIDNYNVGTQNSTLSISMDATGTTEHTVMVNEESLKKMFPHLDDNGYTLDFTDVTVTGDATSGYTFTQNGAHVGGNFTATLRMASTNSRYPNVEIPNVKVTVPEPEFKLTASATGGKLSFASNGNSFNSSSDKLSKGDKLKVTIQDFNSTTHAASMQVSGLALVEAETKVDEGVYTYLVIGDQNPSIAATITAIPADKAVVSLYTNVANESQSAVDLVVNTSSIISNPSVDLNSEVTIKTKAPKGYVLDKVLVDGTVPTSGEDGTYTFTTSDAKAYAVEVYFKQGATITTSVIASTTGKTIKVTANGENVDKDDTLVPKTEITITPSPDTENQKLVSLTVNGTEIKKTGSVYTYKVQAGVNNIVATYESQAVTISAYYFGIASDNVSIIPTSDLKAGTEITIAISGKLPNNVKGIEKVVINGTNVPSSPFKGTLKAGENIVVVYGETTPTLSISGTGSLDKYVKVVNEDGKTLQNGSAVTEDEKLTITIEEVEGYTVDAYFNSTKLNIGTNEVTATAPYSLIVNYTKEEEPTIDEDVAIVPAGTGSTAKMRKIADGNPYWAIDIAPVQGYGVLDVVVNGTSAAQFFSSNTYIFIPQPGSNEATVYLTQEAVVRSTVKGIESSAAGDLTITLQDGGTTVDEDETYEIGTVINIAVAQKEGYKIASLLVNGQKPETCSADNTSAAHKLVVGMNYVEVVYESTTAKEFKVINVGNGDVESTDVTYYKDGAEVSDPTTLNANDNVSLAIESDKSIRQVYFNNASLGYDATTERYTGGTVLAGTNTVYVFFNDAALVKTVYSSEDATVSVKANDTDVAEDTELNKDDEITIKVTPTSQRSVKAVWFNGNKLNTEDFTTAQTFTANVQSGLNVIHVECENIAASVNLTQSGNGDVTLKDADGTDVTSETTTLVKGQKLTLTATPTGDFNAAKVTLNGAPTGVVDNGDGTYTITLVAGVNNVNVEFTKADKGNLMVKFDTKVSDIQIEELNGDKYWPVSQEGKIEGVPSATLLKVSFKVADVGDAIVSAVINGQNYAPLTADADGVYTIGQADLANDRIVLPEGESVLRIYVKTRKTINFAVTQKGYTYNGNPQPVEFTTYPADVKNDPNLKVLYRYRDGNEYLDGAPTNEGDYVVTFSRPADDQYSEVKAESAAYTYKFSIQKAKLMVTQLPTAYPTAGTNSPVEISGGAIGYMNEGMIVPVDYTGAFTTVNGHDPNLQSVNVTLSLDGDEDPNLDYSALYTGTKVCYETQSFKGTHYTIATDNSEVPSFYLTRNGAIISSGDMLDADDLIIPVFEKGLLDLSCYTLYKVDAATGKEIQVNDEATDGFYVKDLQMSTDNPTITLVLRVKDNRQQLAVKDTETTFTIKDKPVYNSYPQPFYPSVSNVSIVVGDKKTVAGSDVYENLVVTYTDAKGNTVLEPVNAGTYTVTISYAADDKYFDFTATAEYTIEKRKLDDLYIKDPVASPLAAGLTLENSTLLGAAEIPGNYKWEDPTNVPTADDDGGVNQHAYFQPIDTQNFGNHRDVGTVRVRILEGVQVVSAHSNYGKVLVKDQTGTALNMPASVAPGTKLTVSAVNTDPTLLELESIAVTMIVDGKETTTTIADGSTITFPEEGNVEIEATFKLKDNSSTIVVPDGQRAVVMPKSVRGAKLSKTGVYTVDYGESFTFTVSTLEADKDKVVVSVNGTTIQPANGVYTISNITEQQNVSVSLTSKTEVKVDIQKEYKLKDGTLIGRVTVVNNTSNDGKFYYNDELTLVAEPVKGVAFSAWSDGNKEDVRKYAIASAEVKLTASFSGVPTGIEDIESAQILAGNECIWVKNVADANVTIVGMTGRIQAQQQISGDTQIRVPAGIYVVVLENGKDVKQVKVIVR